MKVWDEKVEKFVESVDEDAPKFVRAHYPWNEELAREAKVDVPHHEAVKEILAKTAAFEYSIEIACAKDELNTYQVGVFSLGKTKEEANISSWNKTQTEKGFTLLTASVNVNEPKTLNREFFISSGTALSFDDVQPVEQSSGIHTESFIPVKPAVQVGERLGWPTEGYFYHFVDDVLTHEYKLMGEGKWAFQVTRTTEDSLTDELVSDHQYSFILLPWKINNTVVTRQYLLYLPQKMTTEELEELTPAWLDENGCLLDVDAIIQSKSEEKSDRKQTDPETLPPTKIQNIGQSISFTNVYTTPETQKLRHNVVPATKDNAIPERTPILNVSKVEAAAKAIEFGNMAVLALPASTATGGSVLGTLSSNVSKSVGSWALSDAAISGMARLGGGLIAALWPSQLGDGSLDGSLQFNTSDAINTTVRFNLYKDENGTEQIVGIHSGDGYAYGERVAKKVAVRDGDKFVINLEEGITLTWVPDGEEYKLDPSTERPEYDGLDVHDVWVRPIEEHQQELGTALYPEEELVEYIVTFPADAGLPPLYLVFKKTARDDAGVVTGKGEDITGIWLANAGKDLGAAVPSQVADKLRGREFSNFDAFRKAFWTEIQKDKILTEQFSGSNISTMMKGRAPFPRKRDRVGGRVKYEIHHVKEIQHDGSVFDVDNMKITTPKNHIQIHKKGS
ncbi:S-type pyocin domain-containing protein [Aliivibrio logei]|uniref:Pyosin/cloacin translocation domain-containing protein n=1 Tax=Aliivibrio logei TaxID=688 RepID=A0A1B9NUH8_ALILO|nr:S-type pyocin domain-containing protein [Aliivibrio logei]OCH17618.1 hypothetical protein A6E04_18525 [Aliivibrio logei]